jgi:tetratricopeptide (TPR) repeat protein
MKKCLYFALLLAGAVLFQSCAGIIEDARVEPARETVKISPRVLDASINDIEALIDKGLLDQKQTRRARNLVKSIESLRHIPPQGEHALSTRLEKLLANASALIHESLSEPRSPDDEKTVPEDKWLNLNRRIFSAFRAGDHRGVTETAATIEENYGRGALGPETSAVLALSLEAQGRKEKALKTALGAVEGLEDLPDRLVLNAALVRLHAALGKTREAEKWRKKLEQQLTARSLMLAALEKQLGSAAAPEDKDFRSWAKDLSTERPDADEIINSIRQAADKVDEENFLDAREILNRTRQWIEPTGGNAELIDEAMLRLEQAEEVYLKKRITKLSREDLDLSPIADLLARERYKEALSRLEAIERISGSSSEVDEIRETAIERLITRETTRAAESFLAAGREQNPKRKTALLEETRSILRGLLSAYPEAASADRIKSYIERVDNEIKKFNGQGN